MIAFHFKVGIDTVTDSGFEPYGSGVFIGRIIIMIALNSDKPELSPAGIPGSGEHIPFIGAAALRKISVNGNGGNIGLGIVPLQYFGQPILQRVPLAAPVGIPHVDIADYPETQIIIVRRR